MKQGLKFLLQYYIFWLLYFQLARLVFVLVNNCEIASTGLIEIIKAFVYGLKMDMSAAGYILLVPIGLLLILGFFNVNWRAIFKGYTSFLIVVISMLTIADARLYKSWAYRMDLTPLLYLQTPGDAIASFEWQDYTLFPLLIVLMVWLMRKLFLSKFQLSKSWPGTYKNLLVGLVAFIALFLPIRGGLGVAPINIGSVYFSGHLFANHAAVNEFWNMLYNSTKYGDSPSHQWMDEDTASQILRSNNSGEGKTVSVLKTDKPNVILLVLESFTSKMIDLSYEGVEVLPNLNRLKSEGIFFSNLFAASDRSDKAMVSIFSGAPAEPKISIINFPQRTQHLPSLFRSFEHKGYNSAFFYGGNIDFASFRSYFLQLGVDQLLSDEDYPGVEQNSKWGIHDHLMMDILLDSVKQAREPFIYSLFSLSSHEPYNVPSATKFMGAKEEARFLNAAHYTDGALGTFIQNLKESSVWDSTLVIVIADHGHKYPSKSKHLAPEKFNIPMLWLGGALDTSFTYHNLGNQFDLVNTLLAQVQIEDSAFRFGKDLLDSTISNYAYYSFNNGFACNKDSLFQIVNFNAKKGADALETPALELGKAILQETVKNW